MLTQVKCRERGGGLTSRFLPVGELIVRGYTLCPECLEAIPGGIANAFLKAAKRAGDKVKARRQNVGSGEQSEPP